jgi:sugar/nucleoside kinase (ribokinase family)
VLSIGAAVQDVFLRGRIFEAHRETNGDYQQEFELGTKNEVEAITISTGGGATNASVTFARQGLNSMYMGRIGSDVAGKVIMTDLRAENIDTALVKIDDKLHTGYSTILLAPNGERTILTYRGASSHYAITERDFLNVAPDWFYVSSLSDDIETLMNIVRYSKKHGIKLAVNPGTGEIKDKRFLSLLDSFDILSLNKQEMGILFGADKNTEELMIVATKKVPVVLITDGPKGSTASDGQTIYKAGVYDDVPVIDRAGAGDAFTSGFVSAIIKERSIEEALVLASANSTSVVSKIGAKAGILHESHRLHDMEIKSHEL